MNLSGSLMRYNPQSLLALAVEQPSQASINEYLEHGIVKVKAALKKESAELLEHHIERQIDWNLVFDHKGQHQDLNARAVDSWTTQQKEDLSTIVNSQASTGFQYLYENIPLYDIYHSNLLPGHFFNQIIEFLNSERTLNFFRGLLSTPQISFADAQITRFGAGHFLNIHDDNVKDKNRVAAFVINLTKEWRPDWGGALHLLDKQGQITNSFVPSFNEINIFKIPIDHYVGYVSPFATKKASIDYWLVAYW